MKLLNHHEISWAKGCDKMSSSSSITACDFLDIELFNCSFWITVMEVFETAIDLDRFDQELLSESSPTGFSPSISSNPGISLLNFLSFSFNYFSILLQNIKVVWRTSLELLCFNKDHTPQKQSFSGQIIVKLIILKSFDVFSYRSTIVENQFELRDKILLVTSWTEIMIS